MAACPEPERTAVPISSAAKKVPSSSTQSASAHSPSRTGLQAPTQGAYTSTPPVARSSMRYAVTQGPGDAAWAGTYLGTFTPTGWAVTTSPPASTKPPSARLSAHSQVA